MNIPFFHAGKNARESEALPLGLISGLLLLDSGEVERTFIFRCQERYLTYNSLSGLRSLFFVAGNEHRKIYLEKIARRAAFLQEIKIASQIPFSEVPQPLFLPCDTDRLSVEEQDWSADELLSSEIKDSIERGEIFLNQISPSTLKLLTETEKVLSGRGFNVDFNLETLKIPGELALRFHNKAACVRLIRESALELPKHVSTLLIEPADFLVLKSWEELVGLYSARTGDTEPEALFIKSSFDSAGNAAIRLTAGDFNEKKESFDKEIRRTITLEEIDQAQQIAELRADISISPSLKAIDFPDSRLADYKKLQWQERWGIELLVQREVSAKSEMVFDSFGILCFINEPHHYEFVQASAQLYADQDRHHFIGSYVSDDFNKEITETPMLQKLQNLCSIFADQGFRGPIGFDSRLNDDGEHIFIYDVNPRLTAVYPPLAVRSFLRRKNLSASSLMSLGYRGELIYDDLRETLAHFSGNNLLYTPTSQKGLVLLPNLCRHNGFDVVAVNLSKTEILELVLSEILLATANPESSACRRFF